MTDEKDQREDLEFFEAMGLGTEEQRQSFVALATLGQSAKEEESEYVTLLGAATE